MIASRRPDDRERAAGARRSIPRRRNCEERGLSPRAIEDRVKRLVKEIVSLHAVQAVGPAACPRTGQGRSREHSGHCAAPLACRRGGENAAVRSRGRTGEKRGLGSGPISSARRASSAGAAVRTRRFDRGGGARRSGLRSCVPRHPATRAPVASVRSFFASAFYVRSIAYARSVITRGDRTPGAAVRSWYIERGVRARVSAWWRLTRWERVMSNAGVRAHGSASLPPCLATRARSPPSGAASRPRSPSGRSREHRRSPHGSTHAGGAVRLWQSSAGSSRAVSSVRGRFVSALSLPSTALGQRVRGSIGHRTLPIVTSHGCRLIRLALRVLRPVLPWP